MGPEVSTSSYMKAKSHAIPRLATDRSNWFTWKQQTLNSLLSSKGVHKHIEGTIEVLPAIPTYSIGHILDEDKLKELEKIEQKWELHNQHKALIKAQILTTIPEAVVI